MRRPDYSELKALLLEKRRLTGQEICWMRTIANFTQQEFAEMLGISISYLSRVEKGHKALLGKPLDKLARIFVAEEKFGKETVLEVAYMDIQ